MLLTGGACGGAVVRVNRHVTRATSRKSPPYLERDKVGNGVEIVASKVIRERFHQLNLDHWDIITQQWELL